MKLSTLIVFALFFNLYAFPALASAPVFTANPTNQTVTVGSTATLSVTATGATPLSYQWFFNGALFQGATNGTLTVSNISIASLGAYSVVVTNSDGMTISRPAYISSGISQLLGWGNDNYNQFSISYPYGQYIIGTVTRPATVTGNIAAVAAGDYHSLFVKTDGSLWAVGLNNYGQLGINTTQYTNTPTAVASNVVAAAAGYQHSLFVKTDGTLWAMGYNQYGQLGISNNTSVSLPVVVASNVVAVAAGAIHSLFLKADGSMWAMGDNSVGELGNGTTIQANSPVVVASNVVAIAAGNYHSLFLKTDGSLWGMGANNYGQLGIGSTNQQNNPVFITNNVTAVVAGGGHSLFQTTDGSLWGMGANNYGQLGIGSTNQQNNPVFITNNITAIAAGGSHSLFLKNDGSLWAMGGNNNGQLGNGTTNNATIPVNLPGMVLANIFSGDESSVSYAIGVTIAIANQPTNQVVTAGSTVNINATALGVAPLGYQWFGNNVLLVGATNSTLTLTNAGTTNSGTYYLVATNAYGMAISEPCLISVANPQLQDWGYNGNGQLGNGSTGNTNMPINVAGNVVTAAAGNNFSLFLKSDGSLWGMGSSAQLGVGTSLPLTQTNPVPVTNNVIAIAAGYTHALFVKADGSLWAMGNNQSGQLGLGTTNQQYYSPAFVTNNVIAVAAGAQYSLFLKNDGSLWIMGSSITTYSLTPVAIASNVMAIASGYSHSLFLKTDSSLWGMGLNTRGQLGVGSITNQANPVFIASNVVTMAAGIVHSLFVKTDGSLWVMGGNNYGQLGINSTNNQINPTPIASNVVTVASGIYYSLFLKADGTLWDMGLNEYGQLGNGTLLNQTNPVNVTGMALANIISGNSSYSSYAVGLLYGINTQPTNQAVLLGNNAQFSVIASSPLTLSYQWYFNGSPIGGAMSANYSLTGVTSNNLGSYFVVVTTSANSITSNVAMLTPIPVIITASPTNQIATVGGTVNLSVNAVGSAPCYYQWFGNGSELSGATNSSLNFHPAGVTNSGTYYVVITNFYGMLISQPVLVAVGAPQLIDWGNNNAGILGSLAIPNTSVPTSVTSNIVTVAAGLNHSLFLKSDGSLLAIGDNSHGQLGIGTLPYLNYTSTNIASNVVAIAAGQYHSLFLKSDGSLWVTGDNTYGQLGIGSAVGYTNTPVCMASNVVAVAAGQSHSLFLKTDGSLWGMGYNVFGQLGIGTKSNTNVPVFITNNVVTVAAGALHSLFIRADATLWDMGYNNSGQLGLGFASSGSSVPITIASNVVAIAAGYQHTLFLKTDGSLYGMGDNTYGQLGLGSTHYSLTSVSFASNVVAIAAGNAHSLFLKTDGSLWVMGYNGNGQLGNNSTRNASLPVNIPGMALANIISSEASSSSYAIGVPLPPSIASQPTNETVTVGNPAQFNVTAVSIAILNGTALNYQWYLNSNQISGTSTNYLISAATATNAGNYFITFSSAYGSITSSLASLTVIPSGGMANLLNLSGNVTTLNFTGSSGYTYNVLRATNLTDSDWSLIWTTNVPPGGSFQINDSNAPQPAAFYRLQWNQ